MYQEKVVRGTSGWLMLLALLGLEIVAVWQIIQGATTEAVWALIFWLLVAAGDGFCFGGLTVVNPNEARVVMLFGKYQGSLKEAGFWWVNPLTTRRRFSLRIRNFESSKLKVNDHDGNPIEIAAVVVWRVVETAEAMFNVDDYEQFVHVQSEAAVRNLATSYSYDAHDPGQLSLRTSSGEINDKLKSEVQERLAKAGIEVMEARISHLAYAAEIANAMLRRQQASAIIAARQKIVEGAVGMVEMALSALSEKHVVELDEERKAAMVSNLLVVLCSEHNTQPVVNTGTLYQ
jgi:regulator of protease activity HflC (stomatin/prohibitin superfamily)